MLTWHPDPDPDPYQSGSGSIITDADPDPHQNDTDPKHCLKIASSLAVLLNILNLFKYIVNEDFPQKYLNIFLSYESETFEQRF